MKLINPNQNFKVLDCTLRDGGYYNKWNFNQSFVKNYLLTQQKLNTDIVEIGFRKFFKEENKNELGEYLYSNEDTLKKIKIVNYKFKVSVMIDLSDYCTQVNLRKLDVLFTKKYLKYVSMVRIACSYEDKKFLINLIKKLNSLGFKVCVNLMKFTILDNTKIYNFFNNLKNYDIDYFYLADSFGNCTPSKLSSISKYLLKKKINLNKFGFHAHDNMGLAKKNSLTAIKNGFSIVDTSSMGMGRGAGNLKLEELLGNRLDTKAKLLALKNFNKKFMLPLKKKFKWGSNSMYKFSAKNIIHPTYVQRLQDEKKFQQKDIKQIMNFLKKENASKFDTNIFDNFYLDTKKINEPKKFFPKFKKAIIFGDNISVKENISHPRENYLLCSLNLLKNISMRDIDCIFQCNPYRYFTENFLIRKTGKTLIQPNFISQSRINRNENKTFYYNIYKSLNPNISKEGCGYIKNFVLFYALSFLIKNNFHKIKIFGVEKKPQNIKIISDIVYLIKKKNLKTSIIY